VLKSRYETVVVVMHYSPTYATMLGEDERIWPELGSKMIEEVIRETKPTVVVHGHVHKSKRLEARIDNVRVVNVALPARGDIVFLDI
jgi:Icc-related predicted phosphoesterase